MCQIDIKREKQEGRVGGSECEKSGRLFYIEEVFINDRRVRKRMLVEGTGSEAVSQLIVSMVEALLLQSGIICAPLTENITPFICCILMSRV